MQQATITCQDEGCQFLIEGVLTAASVVSTVKQGSRIIQQAAQEICFNFASAEIGDTSAVAMVLVWISSADKHKKIIKFINVPPKLLAVAELGGVAEIIQIHID